MGSCAIIPQVKNKKGEIVDSKLFKDLLSYFSNVREKARHIYLITKSSEFIDKFMPRLKVDENGEPTVRSLLKETNLSTYIPENKVIEKLNKDMGNYRKGTTKPVLYDMTREGYHEAAKKASDFNLTSDFRDEYVAIVTTPTNSKTGEKSYAVEIKKKTKQLAAQAKAADYNETLNNRIRDILQSHGVSIGSLTDLERRLGINGVADFSTAKTIANGMVEMIRLADGVRGEQALPEEFAHWAIEAMGDHPLINRLINIIASNNLEREIIGQDYETYSELYKDNKAKLAKEAAGKLLAKHLLQNVAVPAKPYKNILIRVIEAIKNFLKKFSASQFQRAMNDANSGFSSLANDILSGSLDDVINIKNITESELYYNTNERIQRDKKLLQSIIENEVKRYVIYAKRSTNSNFSTEQEAFILKLRSSLAADIEVEGVYTFLENALKELGHLNNRLVAIQNTQGASINDKAKVLRNIRNYYFSFRHIFDDIRAALVDEERYADNRYGNRVRTALDNSSTLLDDLYISYKNTAMPLFISFIKPIVGDGLVIPFGKDKGRKITAEELITMADKDITFFDRWLDSMAESSDPMLGIMDRLVKNAKEKGRLNTIGISKKLAAAHMELEQAGVHDTAWMFERDSKGNLTGSYIQEINYGLYKEKKREFFESMKAKYGKNPTGTVLQQRQQEVADWFSKNTEKINGVTMPKYSIYKNDDYLNLSPAKRRYYDTVLDIKQTLDSYLPENYTTLYNTVKIRKDLLERVKSSDGVKSGAKQLWESVKDAFIRRSDDTEISDRATMLDFENREVQVLPIYYTKLREGESNNDISTDVTSTMIAYAAMANDFKEMNGIIDALELGRDLLRERKIKQRSGKKGIKEKFEEFGVKVERTLTKSGDETRFMQRLNDFFSMQVYSRYMKDEGTLWGTGMDIGKSANQVNHLTALNSLAVNVVSGISNVATGSVMMNIEAVAGEFFRSGDVIKADKIYGAALLEYLEEVGNRVKVSKLALWDELFNVLQEYEQDVKETNFDRKTWFARMFGTKALFLINNAGEHWMQNRTSLALASQYKMKGPKKSNGEDGEIVNLWDAMEVKYIDPNNKKLGATLVVREGFTKLDGTKLTRQDIIDFSRKSASINQRMHGIYNLADRNAFQALAIGRMASLYRKWIRPSLNRRFKGQYMNFDTNSWTEGYYYTAYRFLIQTAKELKEGQFALMANFHNLTEYEKKNIRRAITEVGHLIVIMGVLALIDWDDKDDRPWALAMLELQLRRLYTEVGAMTPGLQIFNEGFRILKSPMAAINPMEKTINLIGLLNPYNYETVAGEDALLQSGRYKGESRATKLFFESPLVPTNSTIYRDLHPEESIPFYKQ